MEVLVGGRASGKTTKLVNRFHGSGDGFVRNGVIVTRDECSADYLSTLTGTHRSHVLTYRKVAEGALRGRLNTPVFIDNLDLILADIFFPGIVNLATITADKATLLGGEYA